MRATIHPLAIILTAALWALVSIITLGSIVALILPPLCSLYYYVQKACRLGRFIVLRNLDLNFQC